MRGGTWRSSATLDGAHDRRSGPALLAGLVSWEPGARGAGAARPRAVGEATWRTGEGAGVVGVSDTTPAPGIWLMADLDLTNEDELRTMIRSHGAAEGLVTALYASQGWRFVRTLRGAFAIALFDERRRELYLATDHFGIKRLYYVRHPAGAAFSSHAGLLAGLGTSRSDVDATTVYSYLNFGFVPAPASAFRGIRRLPPGHWARLGNGSEKTEQFWDMTYPEHPVRDAEAASAVFRLTEEAVGRAVTGVEPKRLGTFLSGGTDSSTVVGLTSRRTGKGVHAFSIGFREEAYSELTYAETAARHFGAVHHTKIVAPDAALAILPRLAEAYDEPFGNDSAIGTYFCAELARECGIEVLLAGDGGDEIFGGNERYRTDRIFAAYQYVPNGLRRRLLEPILSVTPDRLPVLGRAKRYVRRASVPNPRRFYSYEFFFAGNGGDLLAPDFRAAVETDAPYAIVQGYYDRVATTSELNRLLYLDLKLAIGDNDLFKVTRTAELAGVNVRFPLLDVPLVEFTGTLPSRLKVRGLELRHLFRRAFRALLPRPVLKKRKHGFGVPTSAWLRDHRGFREFARDHLLSTTARQRGYFRRGAVESLLERHQADATPYYGTLLWRLLMLELWHQRHIDRAVPA
jgi:asparagine synthase (glutamine-hydrolysing)